MQPCPPYALDNLSNRGCEGEVVCETKFEDGDVNVGLSKVGEHKVEDG